MKPDSLATKPARTDSPRIPQSVEDQIRMHTQSLTMLPHHAITAMEYLDDQDVPAKVVSDVIEQDVKLATDILSIANSAIFSSGGSVANLTQAIGRVGASRCKNVIIASSIKCAMHSMDLNEEWIKEVLTRHGFLTAVTASRLNIELKCGFTGEEFAAGLIHDFGRLLLGVSYPEQFPEIDPLDFDESGTILAREEATIGTNHCEVGAWFVETQGLPTILTDVVLYHHTPTKSPEHPRLVGLIACADHMANHYQRFAESQAYESQSNPYPKMLESLGVAEAESKFCEIAGTILNQCADEANTMMSI